MYLNLPGTPNTSSEYYMEYAQSLSLRSEELDADTVYSFVPNIGDSDPSLRCTYSKITNGADVDLNHSF